MNVVLIGYRGTGKTTVARLLADRLGSTAIDADDRIEESAGCTIREIFERDGEARFREIEEEVLLQLSGSVGIVLAIGGGAVLRETNRKVLSRLGNVVWLTAEVDTVLERTRGDRTTASRRPNLTAAGGREEVECLLAEREPLYRACADFVVDTSGQTPQEVADRIEGLLRTIVDRRLLPNDSRDSSSPRTPDDASDKD